MITFRKLLLALVASIIWTGGAHAQTTVPGIPFFASTPLTGGELLYCAQSLADRKCTVQNIWDGINTAQVITIGGLSVPLPKSSGGNGTATPALTAGPGVSIGGTWPGYTISASSVGGLVNKFRNGTFDESQRGYSQTISSSGNYAFDGWRIYFTGSSSVAVSNGPGAGVGTIQSMQVAGASGNTGIGTYQRIESVVAAPLGTGQSVTFQIQYYQNTGVAVTPILSTCYASAQDNFTTCTTDLATTNLTSCASGTWCTESYTFTPSSNAYLGYQVYFNCGAAFTSSSVYCRVTAADIRVTPGVATGISSPPAPELRPLYAEALFDRRYYQKLGGTAVADILVTGYETAGSGVSGNLSIIPMRVVPTATIVGSWTLANVSSENFYMGISTISIEVIATATGVVYYYTNGSTTYITLSAEL